MDNPASFVRGKIGKDVPFWFKAVFSKNSTLVFTVALLGIKFCATTRDKLSSEKHTASELRGGVT